MLGLNGERLEQLGIHRRPRDTPRLIASDILHVPTIALVADATRLPFAAASLRGVVMTNVLHHLPDVRAFFLEAARCVKPGGALVMIEPWVTAWSSFVYRSFHDEPFEPQAERWEFDGGGRLTAANGALPWIVFHRDRAAFEREFPEWRVDAVDLSVGSPFRYLLSGGVSLNALTPDGSFAVWRLIERVFLPFMSHWAMFAVIRLTRVP